MYYIFINVVYKQLYINRNIMLISYPAENHKRKLINKKFNSIYKHMQIHNCVQRTEMASIIDLIDSVRKYKQTRIIALYIMQY